MSVHPLHSATMHWLRVSDKTCWIFLQLRTRDGFIGHGEATLNGQEDAVAVAAAALVPLALAHASHARPAEFASRHFPRDLPEAAALCAIDQALWELNAVAAQTPLARALGAEHCGAIPVYANINRRTIDRSPQGFADSAIAAVAAGHCAFKLAPFDEVSTGLCERGQGLHAMRAGLERIAAVRAVVGPRARLMVDCHWRFDETTAIALNEAAAALGVYWIECPLPEVPANIPALARLRKQANALGMRQAGLEEGIRWEAFRPYCEGGAYDVVMPDIKYVGGIAEMLHLARCCAPLGVQVSPHNPSGPVCHAASLQVCGALASFDMLELQFDESPLFGALVSPPFAPVHAGTTVLPTGTGLGVQLDQAMLQAHAGRAARSWAA